MEWLNKLIERILEVVPRLWFVHPNESGVRITLGRFVRDTPTGWYVYWPLIQDCLKLDVTPQVVDLKNQSLMTTDGKQVVVSAAIQYRICDARKALLEVMNFDKSLQTLALGIVAKYVSTTQFDKVDAAKMKSQVRDGVQREVEDWGLKIEKVYITDLVVARHLRLLTDGEKTVPGNVI